jgi:PAS domain-containing protein
MSDYIAGLRADLVEAAARHQEQSALRRRALPVLPKAWSRPALAAAGALAACVAVIVIAVATIGPPSPTPAKPHPVRILPLGTDAFDAVYAGGDLWVAGSDGDVVRVRGGRAISRIHVGTQVKSISSDGRSIWLTTQGGGLKNSSGESHGDLIELDIRTGAITRKIQKLISDVGPVEAGAGAVWFVPDDSQAHDVLERRDPATGRRIATVKFTQNSAMAAGPDVLWGIDGDGTVAEVDPRVNRIVAKTPAVHLNGPEEGQPGKTSLAADGDGVWVAGGARGDVALVQAGRVARRIRIGEGNVSAVARTRDALWVAIGGEGLTARYRVIRVDPDNGRQTGMVELGTLRPTALAAAGKDLWVITLGGRALLIR